jgi:aquaporin Z
MKQKVVHFHPVVRFYHYLAEFTATLIFMFLGILSIILLWGFPEAQEIIPNTQLRLIIGFLVFFLGTLIIIYSPLGKISGAHMNPAVSFAFWMEKHMGTVDFVFYVVAQTLGAIVAVYLLYVIFPEAANSVQLGLPRPKEYSWTLIEFLGEMFSTALLITLVFFCLSEYFLVKYTGILVGFYTFFVKVMIVEVTGASLNPVRYLGPSLVVGDHVHTWIYVGAPIAGTFLAIVLHRYWLVLKRPQFFRLNHRHGYVEELFSRYKDVEFKKK